MDQSNNPTIKEHIKSMLESPDFKNDPRVKNDLVGYASNGDRDSYAKLLRIYEYHVPDGDTRIGDLNSRAPTKQSIVELRKLVEAGEY